MLWLATVSPSDEFNPVWIELAISAFFLALALSLLLLVLTYLAAGTQPYWPMLSVASFLLALFPVAYCWYVHEIDSSGFEFEGGKAFGPLWRALLLPSLPLVLAAIAFWRAKSKMHSPVAQVSP